MTTKSATIRARIEPDLKSRAENIFRQIGMNATEAITLFYKQVELRKGLPFNVVIPNETTRKTLEQAEAGEELIMCADAKDLFKQLGI
ncbi:MAG: type II toxin-antitoxin system RelB/DinJ family antitoxin [Kiritimatiellae bacterium]|nr:type II toxin-antitoxin system RelB/DinJ family antitoxin [Kiritimatiellia bacterium]